ncbi:Rec8 like protein-domain-containing protein [Irpex rosettiformis]|uniref:Rec8 like protein-domain-containing protein n=1 Tax=Irpex rosettiformis TaxID=378272 RepID=A0ACB8TTG5_9APHY|nr:Rec8 like protein-domain-containing protein [Irpex rosettiformis]
MFYSEAILSRRGPLAKVWLAAHMERKLSKTQTLQTDIEQSARAIIGEEVEIMALRLSGQLLLGVVRIYSRKAKYLLDDCNEALLKIKMAFRPGIVDMTEDQLAVNRNAITLQGNTLDIDALLPDINWDINYDERPIQSGGQHIARTADITLAAAEDFQYDLGFDDLAPPDIGSNDFEELDLGLDFGDGPVSVRGGSVVPRSEAEDSMEVEVGRDAARTRPPRESLASQLLGRHDMDADLDLLSYRSREESEHPFAGDMSVDLHPELGELDLGLDFGDGERTPSEPGMDLDQVPTPRMTPPELTPSRALSPLTEPPQTPPPDLGITPLETEATLGRKKGKEKKQIIDAVTELANGPGARIGRGRGAGLGQPVDVGNIVTEHPFLPRSTVVMRLLEIRQDPISHFLPTKSTPNGTFFCAAPPGMAPELAELFMRPVQNLAASKRRGSPAQQDSPSKKPRVEGSVVDDDEEVGMARRGSRAPSLAFGSDILGGRASMDPGFEFADNTGVGEDFQMDIPDADVQLDVRDRSKSVLSDLSRLSTPVPENAPLDEGEESYADVTCPIATFDDRSTQSQEANQHDDGKGYSKNTVKALRIIRQELQPTTEEPEKVMSFKKMSQKASRRAASSFFFELLVLGTRDCVKVSQAAPHDNIEIRAKDKLWERQRHTSVVHSVSSALQPGASQISPGPSGRRQGSVTPSIGSALGL